VCGTTGAKATSIHLLDAEIPPFHAADSLSLGTKSWPRRFPVAFFVLLALDKLFLNVITITYMGRAKSPHAAFDLLDTTPGNAPTLREKLR
jgi:hypothetical protein